MKEYHLNRKAGRLLAVSGFMLACTGCAAVGLTTSVGPSRGEVDAALKNHSIDGLRIIDLDSVAAVAGHGLVPARGFAETIGSAIPLGSVVGPGDVLSVAVVEAPPAVLFGGGANPDDSSGSTGALPEIVVEPSGMIDVPFAGRLMAAGRTPEQVARDIQGRLRAKAHLPQVSVRISHNASANATVIGEVTNSVRMPLTPKGERLLDALAAAGGVRQASNKITVQLTRAGQVASMPLEDVIKNPRENIVLVPDDVVTAIYQPFSFTVLGASSKSSEVEFEATGITLAQALGRVGGLQDQRANPRGVFLFRWESEVDPDSGTPRRIPTIYRIDMKNPATYFLMQNFAMHDQDVMYVANSSLAELQRFMSIVASTILPLNTLNNVTGLTR